RQDQDRFALLSQQRTHAAQQAARFDDEIVPVEIPQRKGSPTVVKVDEHPRPETTLEDLAKLPPAFAKDGTVTAGNSSGINGGAVALGHPLGCSGARLVTTLAHYLRRNGARRGLATLCVGVGQGVATVIEAAV